MVRIKSTTNGHCQRAGSNQNGGETDVMSVSPELLVIGERYMSMLSGREDLWRTKFGAPGA